MRTEQDNFFGVPSQTCPPYYFSPDEDNWPEPGPYITLEDFFAGVEYGIYSPDDGSYYWVSIQADGHLKETLINKPREPQPAATICVAYYSK